MNNIVPDPLQHLAGSKIREVRSYSPQAADYLEWLRGHFGLEGAAAAARAVLRLCPELEPTGEFNLWDRLPSAPDNPSSKWEPGGFL